jgi:hypothetical protein
MDRIKAIDRIAIPAVDFDLQGRSRHANSIENQSTLAAVG